MPVGRTVFIFLGATLAGIVVAREIAMTTHSKIRKGVRTLVASLFATCLFAVWPSSDKAGSHTTHVQNHELSAKSIAPARAKTKGTTAIGDIKEESTDKGHTNWKTGKSSKSKK